MRMLGKKQGLTTQSEQWNNGNFGQQVQAKILEELNIYV